MNKQELIDAIADRCGSAKTEAENMLNAFTGIITDELSKKEKVAILGFGNFETGERAARQGRNPQTGELMNIPAATVAKFKAGKKLREAVNGKDGK